MTISNYYEIITDMKNQNTEYRKPDAQMPTDADIMNAIQADMQALIPPPQVKVDIFKSLNFASSSSGAVAGSLISMIKKSAIPIAAGLAIYFASTLNHNNIELQNKQMKIAQDYITKTYKTTDKNSNEVAEPNKLSSIPMTSSKSVDVNTNHKVKHSASPNHSSFSSNTENIAAKTEEQISTTNESIDTQIATNNLMESRNILANSLIQSKSFHGLTTKTNFASNYRSMPSIGFENSNSTKAGFTLTLRGLASSTFAENYNFSSSLGNSFAFGIYTPLSGSDQFSIGIEGGREPFQKKFFDKYSQGELSYIDNPNTIWGAIGVKMRLSDFELGGIEFHPYSSVLLGAGAIGPMGRISAGIEHNISSNISAFVAAEGATMLYNNRVNWYSSNKFGLTFGLNYQF